MTFVGILSIAVPAALLLSLIAMNVFRSRRQALNGHWIEHGGKQPTWRKYNVDFRSAGGRAARSELSGDPRHRQTPSVSEAAARARRTPEDYASRSCQVPAALPLGKRIYAIGDIHGRVDLLRIALAKLDKHQAKYPTNEAILVFLGDYVDRGPTSREVLDVLVECGKGRESVFLKGNHESFVSDFLQDPGVLDRWCDCGGLQTLLSYGLKPSFSPDEMEKKELAEQLVRAMPGEHVAFLQSLRPYFVCGDFLFVHAGIRPNIPLECQNESDFLWIRDEFLEYERPFDFFIVHGHTPVRAPEVRSNRINIDTGAFATGRLTCIAIERSTIVAL